MKPEQILNEHISNIMLGVWEATRVETLGVSWLDGFPDWVYSLPNAGGFIESKYLKAWPKRPTTGINIPHFKASQKRFLYSHGKKKGKGAFFLLQVDDDVILFPWTTIYDIDRSTKNRLKDLSIFHWKMSDFPKASIKNKTAVFLIFRDRLINVLSKY